MSDLANAAVQPGADLSSADAAVTLSEDDELGAVWDQMQRDNGAERGDDGRFQSAGGDEAGSGPAPEDVDGGDADGTEVAAQTPPAVALPPNWNGMDEDWKKIPPDVQAKIATRDAELHARMSEQGRQISGFRPFMEIVGKNQDLFDGKVMPDGTAITPEFAINYLMGIQRRMDSDPIRTLLEISEQFGLTGDLAAVLSGRAPIPAATVQKTPAAATAADVEAMVERALTKQNQSSAMEQELSRLTKDKPLYADIPEGDMVDYIHKAREKLGQAASTEAVFNRAYDMAVNADPDLRKKAAAASKPAAPTPSKTAEAARRAASVNATSRQTGKGREPTEDELLAAAYDAAHAKD